MDKVRPLCMDFFKQGFCNRRGPHNQGCLFRHDEIEGKGKIVGDEEVVVEVKGTWAGVPTVLPTVALMAFKSTIFMLPLPSSQYMFIISVSGSPVTWACESGKKRESGVDVLRDVWRVREEVQPLLVELPRCKGIAGGDCILFLAPLELARLLLLTLDGDEGMV